MKLLHHGQETQAPIIAANGINANTTGKTLFISIRTLPLVHRIERASPGKVAAGVNLLFGTRSPGSGL
jgi:hypothetical protein